MLQLAPKIAEAAESIRRRWDHTPRVGIILGTGLGGLAELPLLPGQLKMAVLDLKEKLEQQVHEARERDDAPPAGVGCFPWVPLRGSNPCHLHAGSNDKILRHVAATRGSVVRAVGVPANLI